MAFGIFNPDTGSTRRLGLLQRPGVVGPLGSQPPVAIEENPQASRGPKLPSLPELASQPGITEPATAHTPPSPLLDPQDKPPDFQDLLVQALLNLGSTPPQGSGVTPGSPGVSGLPTPQETGSSLASAQASQAALQQADERVKALEEAGVSEPALREARERNEARRRRLMGGRFAQLPFDQRPVGLRHS